MWTSGTLDGLVKYLDTIVQVYCYCAFNVELTPMMVNLDCGIDY